MKKILAVLLIFIFILTSCKEGTIRLTEKDIEKDPPLPPVVTNEDTSEIIDTAKTPEEAVTDFGVDLFKESYDKSKNTLVSPVSVSLALAMTSGGSSGNSFSEFETILGRGVSMKDMYDFFKSFSDKIDDSEKTEVNVANSIWIRDNKNMISVKDSFINFADSYFDADVFLSPFNKSTVKDINSWVRDETNGMIKKAIDEIDPLTVMYLINALSFEADWKSKYNDTNEHFVFTNKDGDKEKTTGMISSEHIYIEDENTVGFIKNYKGDEYSFAVLLPNSDTDIDSYVSTLSGEKVKNLLDNRQSVSVDTVLPKFSFEFDVLLNDPLQKMGLTSPFNPGLSDLSEIGSSSMGNLYISSVIHKTFIEVAEKGTKAAAVTVVDVKAESAMPIEKTKRVVVDRPFVFMIIENETDIPLFMGSVLSVK